MTDADVPVTEQCVSPPSLPGPFALGSLIRATDLHIAPFIGAHSNTAAKQLSKFTVWGAADLRPPINGSARANNSQVIWIQLPRTERKCGLSPQPITRKRKEQKEKTSASRSYCIERRRVSAAGLRPREFTDLICCCITLTKGFVLCTQQLMTWFLKYCNAGGWQTPCNNREKYYKISNFNEPMYYHFTTHVKKWKPRHWKIPVCG